MICKCIAISANWLTLNMRGKQNEEEKENNFTCMPPGPSPPVPHRTHTMLLGKGINYMYIMLLQDLSIKCLYINILL